MKNNFLTFLAVFAWALSSLAFADTVVRDVRDGNGNEFRVTVVAPNSIDQRIFDMLGDNEESSRDELADAANDNLINLSGYKIEIVAKPTVIGCKSLYQLIVKTPAILDPGESFTVSGSFAEEIDVTAFPTEGNVNVLVASDSGKGIKLCQRSKRKRNRLDAAGCYFPGCFNDKFVLIAQIENPSSSVPASFVASVGTFFVNP